MTVNASLTNDLYEFVNRPINIEVGPVRKRCEPTP
jgi:hypothetical protein